MSTEIVTPTPAPLTPAPETADPAVMPDSGSTSTPNGTAAPLPASGPTPAPAADPWLAIVEEVGAMAVEAAGLVASPSIASKVAFGERLAIAAFKAIDVARTTPITPENILGLLPAKISPVVATTAQNPAS